MPDAVNPAEQSLSTGGVTHVVRVGGTVRRPVRPFTATVQAYLAHLHAHGFDAAPVALGYDEQGREVLSFVEGDVPTDPLPDDACDDAVLVDLARARNSTLTMHAAAEVDPVFRAWWDGGVGERLPRAAAWLAAEAAAIGRRLTA